METFIIQTVAPALLQYVVELSISFVSEAALAVYQAEAQEKLARAKNLKDVELFHSMDTFTAELIAVSDSVIRQTKETLKLGEQHAPLLRLFEDRNFLNDLGLWLVLGQQGDGAQAKTNLETRMIATLRGGGTKPELVTEFQKTFFALIERDLARNPTLYQWQNKALLIALRGDVKAVHEDIINIKNIVSEPKHFTPEQLQQALIRYRDLTLKFCDILDLAGLPEDDHNLVRKGKDFLLRNFYMPLRMDADVTLRLTDKALDDLEMQREQERLHSAGRTKIGRKTTLRVSIGERLQQKGYSSETVAHFMMLGDPGAGKTTLIRWLVTAYLLKMKQDDDFAQLPDVKTLPDRDWLPILIRCRELDEDSLRGGLDDMLRQTLKKAELVNATEVLLVALKQQLQAGKALLLIDGLDEIADHTMRVRFCQQLEIVAKRYPQVTMLITSRIVGYREMSFKMGRSFDHLVVSDLSKADKDEFACRWCEATELEERCAQATTDLIKAIHSNDRIERLTGNPMLLTTLALVKRKVGKLPTRRADLYQEAIEVLLHWRSEVDEPLDKQEALPQLEYVAYEMCRRGEQRLREDEVLVLLEEIREKHSQRKTHPLHTHSPEEFLKILKHRTSILMEVGIMKHNGLLVPVYEFRHLTFQEYLASLALLQGEFLECDKKKPLAQWIAPLAGKIEEVKGEFVVSENWREALRLCISNCNLNDVDEAIEAVLTPLNTEDAAKTIRPRAILAALCLADEPNVSEDVGNHVLQVFSQQVGKYDGMGNINTSLDATVIELSHSVWAQKLQRELAYEFCQQEAKVRFRLGNLCGAVGEEMICSLPNPTTELNRLIAQLGNVNEVESIVISLAIMRIAHNPRSFPSNLVLYTLNKLSLLLTRSAAMAHAAAWAMATLNFHYSSQVINWTASKVNIQVILACLKQSNFDKVATQWLIDFVGRIRETQAVEPLIAKLADDDKDVRSAVCDALGKIKDERSVEPLIYKLNHEDQSVVKKALCYALGEIRDIRGVDPLLVQIIQLDNSSDVINAVYEALGKIGGQRAAKALIAKLYDEEYEGRELILTALTRITGKNYEPRD